MGRTETKKTNFFIFPKFLKIFFFFLINFLVLGAVYRVADERGEYAMKVEGINEPIQVLKIETTVLQEMNDIGGRHQTKLEAKGKTATYNYLVMGLVGRNLLDLRKV